MRMQSWRWRRLLRVLEVTSIGFFNVHNVGLYQVTCDTWRYFGSRVLILCHRCQCQRSSIGPLGAWSWRGIRPIFTHWFCHSKNEPSASQVWTAKDTTIVIVDLLSTCQPVSWGRYKVVVAVYPINRLSHAVDWCSPVRSISLKFTSS